MPVDPAAGPGQECNQVCDIAGGPEPLQRVHLCEAVDGFLVLAVQEQGRGPSTRARIVEAAAAILDAAGREAVSTRSVSMAAGVQPPAIYRLFGDMHGLLDAVASFGFGEYLARKTSAAPEPDPVDGLRRGWDLHIGFGLSHPALYSLMYGRRAGSRWTWTPRPE